MLQSRSLWFNTPINTRTSHALQNARKEQILKETFQTLSKNEHSSKSEPKIIKEAIPLAYSIPDKHANRADLVMFQRERLDANILVASLDFNPAIRVPSQTTIELNLAGFSMPSRPNPPEQKLRMALPQKHPEWPVALAELMPPNIETLHVPMVAYENRAMAASEILDQGVARRALLTIPNPPLPSFPTLDELETNTYSDFFDLDLVCLSRQEEGGYLFAITIIPHADLQLPKFDQHYNFLIDRANSIQRDRLVASKNAVLKALNELSPDDTFNIIVFDNKVEKLFSSSKSPDVVTISQAKSFLDTVNLGSFFTPADLYKSLLLTLPQQVRNDELYTNILMTDGENLAKKSAQHSILQTWTWQNNNRVALYSISMSSDHQLANLDVASALNKGCLYTSTTNSGIKRKILKLMKNIQTPIAKNISCHAINKSSSQPIELYPGSYELPYLYLDQPFVIIGVTDSLDDFILFVQGRLKDRWMNIKKTISFVNAKKASQSLKQEWAHHQAYRCYNRYTRDANPSHLAEAREWLQPFGIPPAFQ